MGVKSTLRSVLRRVGRQPFARRLIAAMQEPQLSAELPKGNIEIQEFVDSSGNRYILRPDLRSRLKPGWQAMFQASDFILIPDDEEITRRHENAKDSILTIFGLIDCLDLNSTRRDVLEFGAFDGARAFVIKEFGASSVVATDLSRYYVNQLHSAKVNEVEIARATAQLAELRSVIGGTEYESVTFLEDDVTQSTLPSESFDLIVSFEVLEHVLNPASTMKALHRLLKPGGIAFHEYNPFFSLIGGHSLCTLDIPWGHAQLNEADFEKYLRQFRPDEVEVAMRFFKGNLNRMSLVDLRLFAREAELEIVYMTPWNSQQATKYLNAATLSNIQRHYPTVNVDDLMAEIVWVVLRKPPS